MEAAGVHVHRGREEKGEEQGNDTTPHRQPKMDNVSALCGFSLSLSLSVELHSLHIIIMHMHT